MPISSKKKFDIFLYLSLGFFFACARTPQQQSQENTSSVASAMSFSMKVPAGVSQWLQQGSKAELKADIDKLIDTRVTFSKEIIYDQSTGSALISFNEYQTNTGEKEKLTINQTFNDMELNIIGVDTRTNQPVLLYAGKVYTKDGSQEIQIKAGKNNLQTTLSCQYQDACGNLATPNINTDVNIASPENPELNVEVSVDGEESVGSNYVIAREILKNCRDKVLNTANASQGGCQSNMFQQFVDGVKACQSITTLSNEEIDKLTTRKSYIFFGGSLDSWLAKCKIFFPNN